MGAFADVQPVSDLLVAPEVTPAELDVPPEWKAADEIFQTVRDTSNEIIGVMGKFGFHLDELPGGDLADILITPFSGDYNRIRANGVACQHTAKGMRAVAKNVSAATADLQLHWSGPAARAFTQQVGAYAAVTTAASVVMDQGFKIFDVVADQVEELAELAVKVIVRLAKILVRLSKNIASRFAGWLAWVKLAKDIATDGLDPIQDIYDDIKATVEIVFSLFDLKDAIEVYVESVRQQFFHFLGLPELVSDLPAVVDAPLSTVLRNTREAQEWKDTKKELDTKADKAEDELDQAAADADEQLGGAMDDADQAGDEAE